MYPAPESRNATTVPGGGEHSFCLPAHQMWNR